MKMNLMTPMNSSYLSFLRRNKYSNPETYHIILQNFLPILECYSELKGMWWLKDFIDVLNSLPHTFDPPLE